MNRSFESRDEYYDFVELLWRRNLEVDGSSPEWVAKSVITATKHFSDPDEVTIKSTGGVYTDERVCPVSIVISSEQDYPYDLAENRFYEAAVRILTQDLCEIREEIDSQ